MTNRNEIIELLRTNDKAVARALVVLTERQTADEQRSENTKYDNGRGFRPCHARMGTSMSKFFKARGYLTEKQIAYWRVPQKDGKMRIEIYAGQLLDIAQRKAAAKQVAAKSGAQYGVYTPATNMRKVNGEWTHEDVGNREEAMLVEREIRETEAAADRKQTMIDEHNKFLARLRAEA